MQQETNITWCAWDQQFETTVGANNITSMTTPTFAPWSSGQELEHGYLTRGNTPTAKAGAEAFGRIRPLCVPTWLSSGYCVNNKCLPCAHHCVYSCLHVGTCSTIPGERALSPFHVYGLGLSNNVFQIFLLYVQEDRKNRKPRFVANVACFAYR